MKIPTVKAVYEKFLGEPNSEKAHQLLHTHYFKRSTVDGKVIAEEQKPSKSNKSVGRGAERVKSKR